MLTKILLSALATVTLYAAEVNVYSHRHYPSDEQLFKRFTAKTGIKINLIKAGSDELISRLEKEGKNSPADVLITVDAARLHIAKEKGLLSPLKSAVLEANIPPHLRDKEGYWYALTKRARVFVYNKETFNPAKLSTYEALATHEFKGKILVQSSNNVYNQSLLASLIVHDGETEASKWARGIVANMARKPSGKDIDQIRAVAAGVGDVAIINTYYLGQLVSSKRPSDQAAGEMVAVYFPNQKTTGTHINVSGAGIVKYSKHRPEAQQFIEFLSSPEAQEVFAEVNFEYPVNPKVKASKLLRSWGTFKEDDTELYKLGEHNAQAVKIFDKSGWN
ncbi:Fe(3+) ABC transporter substrate-binding protein [uncultured Sulfuricurvum sp.]|uniref:Fe(3+) ABC transporter substrate-binding protein n=1 Tax=uncultured Sulfuricurvum sp. TaxID=430693 RepID=UPI0026261B2B|nr:Fe(3+) ABC transporter substrate-binding protein [uncultured Sulfuricurvum sp.]